MTDPDVLAPNLKRRLSGVTATIARLVPIQAERIAIAATGPGLPAHVPHIPLSRVPFLKRRPRVWHARRNTEMLMGLALRAAGQPLRLLFTSASQRTHSDYSKRLIARMDRVIATSAKGAGYLERPVDVVMHGIDPEGFAPAPDRAALRRSLGLPEDAVIFGCFGRIRRQKGTDVFVDAMLDLCDRCERGDRHPEVHALVMGRAVGKDNAFERGLKDKVAARGHGARFTLGGEVPVHQIAPRYAALDVFVAPQRWEGFGLTPLEAMACALPVVATPVGAFEEIVLPEQTGLIVPPGDPAAMAAAMERLMDPALGTAWGAAGRARVLKDFTLQGEADALVRIYREMLAD